MNYSMELNILKDLIIDNLNNVNTLISIHIYIAKTMDLLK
jgi:hypothetical protein